MSAGGVENISLEYLELLAENMVYVRKLGWVPKLQRRNLIDLQSATGWVLEASKKIVLTEKWRGAVTLCWLLLRY